ncbi:MAG: S-adenosylmethionine:tRNA ribosyltransferase-isomerase [Bacteroidia bacterium]|jgi:S-adenosylmethionine:tRNA ribosyltransferase-isomerase|nr:S-adenosylmethionine:tRNA ribosyltransferase-isomerase [Bacteroidia bacterium]
MIKKSDFNFKLDEERIAKYPLERRDESKLLVYKDAVFSHHVFKNIGKTLGSDTLIVRNNAKVIPARLYFKRATGALIEVLLLEPIQPSNYERAFAATSSCQWKCIIGNSKKWKVDELIALVGNDELVQAKLVSRQDRVVELSWQNGKAFTDLLDEIGELPLPPYLNRDTEVADKQTYQTVFARNSGSVAAPTAGLHFTSEVLSLLEGKGIATAEVTLHVGAGTFLPVKADNVVDHDMHREYFEVSKDELLCLMAKDKRIAVGTTSLRVLESLYWIGRQLSQGDSNLLVHKLEPYEVETSLSYVESLQHIVRYMDIEGLSTLQGATEILILPHYTPRSIDALITNFHLPESTLLMLIASVVGDEWKEIYAEAMRNDYRFLSYGDCSLLFVS